MKTRFWLEYLSCAMWLVYWGHEVGTATNWISLCLSVASVAAFMFMLWITISQEMLLRELKASREHLLEQLLNARREINELLGQLIKERSE